jgi:hypothetical protein
MVFYTWELEDQSSATLCDLELYLRNINCPRIAIVCKEMVDAS